ncbi:universal stress protein [Anderseniella sp. Alg231-50]|uniref:universal stress protein n=1 Tax=Anderseniella sp. Alg231-50 TaxID=1922226 RepID=UPI000D562EBA
MDSYKTILIIFRSPQQAEHLCLLADGLASIWQSHVLGFHARPGVSVNVGLRGSELKEWLDAKRRFINEQEANTKAIFEHYASQSGQNWQWRTLDADLMSGGDTALDLAKCADLVLINRLEHGSTLMNPDMTLEQLMFETGRPVIVVPQNYSGRKTGQRIVIAWNGTREASRAAFDALPLVSNTSSDCVRLVCPPVPENSSRQLPQGADLAEALARHGVEPEIKPLPGRHADAGAEILAECEEFDADLLAMGAYGHSRLREYVFGGATETILNDASIPVLLSR